MPLGASRGRSKEIKRILNTFKKKVHVFWSMTDGQTDKSIYGLDSQIQRNFHCLTFSRENYFYPFCYGLTFWRSDNVNYRVAFTTNKQKKRLKKLHSNKSRSDIKEMKINLVKYIFVSNLIVQPINIHFISCQKSPK